MRHSFEYFIMRQYPLFLAAIAFTLIAADISVSQDRQDIEQVGRIYNHWSGAYDVAIQGDYAYVTAGYSGLQIVDISDPVRPVVVGWYDDNPYLVQSVFVSGDYAYVTDPGEFGFNTDTWGGLLIIDISDPTDPREVGCCSDGESSAYDVFVSGDYAYIAELARWVAGPGNIRVVDVSDPQNPEEVATYNTPGYIWEIFVDGDYAYAAMAGCHQGSHGLLVFDVSDPVNLEEICRYLEMWNGAVAVYVVDDYAYVSFYDGLHVIDVSDPTSPEDVGEFQMDWTADRLFVSGEYAYLVGYNGNNDEGFLRIIDVSDPAEPVEIGAYSRELYRADGIALAGDYAYTAGSDVIDFGNYHETLKGNLLTIDVSVPENPQEVSIYTTGGNIHDLCVLGDFAYAADGVNGLRVIDVSDSANPEEVAVYEDVGAAKAVFVSGDYAYVAETSNIGEGGGFHVIDISDPTNPEEVGSCHTDDYTRIILVSGDYAYLAGYDITRDMGIDEGSLRVIDVSDPENPEEIGAYFIGDTFYSLFVSDGFIYAGVYHVEDHRGINGLRIVDISNPDNFEEVGFLRTDKAYGIYVDGDYAYVSVESYSYQDRIYTYSFRVIDVVDRENPEIIGVCEIPSRGSDVFVSGDYAYVADGWEGGVRIINISNPENPVEIAFYDTPGLALSVSAPGGLIYVGDYTNVGIYRYVGGQGGDVRNLTVPMREGWNLISLNIIPWRAMWLRDEGPDVVRMTDLLRIDEDNHHIILMKNEDGLFYTPAFGFNNIPYWDLTQGYLVKVDEDVETIWTGESIPADADVPLEEGWNYIAYFPTYQLDADAPDFHVLSPIIDHVIIAKDIDGHFLIPAFNYSNMPLWRETQGYLVKVDDDVVLNYPPEQDEIAEITVETEQVAQAHWRVPTPTGTNMSVLINRIDHAIINDGDQIAAFTTEGRLFGAGRVQDGRCGMVVWGDDPTTVSVEGAVNGEAFILRLWDADHQVERNLEVTEVREGEGLIYETDALAVLDVSANLAIPLEFGISAVYPNPFNATARLRYTMAKAGIARLVLYDVNGCDIIELINNHLRPGAHEVEVDASNWSSGVYIAALKTGQQVDMVKLICVK